MVKRSKKSVGYECLEGRTNARRGDMSKRSNFNRFRGVVWEGWGFQLPALVLQCSPQTLLLHTTHCDVGGVYLLFSLLIVK